MFKNIEISKTWREITLLDKGWSKDRKYKIIDEFNNKYLLRVSPKNLYEKRKEQFELMQKIKQLEINAPKILDFGVLNDEEIYMLLTWVDGEDASEAIKQYNIQSQYELGFKAGKILYKIHSLDSSIDLNYFINYKVKINQKIERIKECPITFLKCELVINYLLENIEFLNNKELKITHGDFHIGNMLIKDNKIYIIDFDKIKKYNFYDDFKPFCWNVYASPYFASGIINGYFNNNIPSDFFKILSIYAAETLISHLPWAITFGEKEVETALKVANDTLKWFDDFKVEIPLWYKKI